ncbi:MAG: helix-hairpin-helix domain-containing protein [Burkholderiales bacterium]|nr:MAG: helix-hairpin-helix domain-containing protein [Burkholderiales bacterium]
MAAVAFGCALVGGASALDANTATRAELETIRGVGPALSARIVEARRTQPFADLDDLKARVRGVGDANLRRMREDGLVVGTSGRVQTFVGQPASRREARPKRKPPVDAAGPAAASGQPATARRRR